MSLNRQQVEALLRPIKGHRVLKAEGQSHVPAYDVAAHLTRIFGFCGWDKQILSLNLIAEDIKERAGKTPLFVVTYSCTLGLTIKDPDGKIAGYWEDGACGTANLPQKGEAHDMAMKSAISYALKRCAAFGLGDQFGLSLYNKGNMAALVGKTLVMPTDLREWAASLNSPSVPAPRSDVDLESHIAKPESLGNDETDYGRPFGEGAQ